MLQTVIAKSVLHIQTKWCILDIIYGLTTATASQPRNMFQRRNVLNELSHAEFIKRYPLNRDSIFYVTNLVREALSNDTNRRNPSQPRDEGHHNSTLSCYWKNANVQQQQPRPITTCHQQSYHSDH